MKLFFAFFITFYFVVSFTECDVKTNYGEQRRKLDDNAGKDAVNKSRILPMLANISLGNDVRFEFDLDETLAGNEAGGKLCLQNLTSCMAEDEYYKETTDILSSFIFSTVPPFDLSDIQGVSEMCQTQSRQYIEDLRNFKFWALKMYDSTAKVPSGILNGNVNQFGDFDMCLASNIESDGIGGQYCLASLEIQTPYSPYLAALHKLLQSHYHFRSKLEDPGHRVPRFSSINWALCVPTACTPQDVEIGIKRRMENLIANTELKVRIDVKPSMCYTNEKKDFPLSTILAMVVFGMILFFELIATVYDNYATGEKNGWITAFSFKRNLTTLTRIKRAPGDIEAVHGIRMLNAILLLLGHKSMALFFLPIANRTEYVEYISRPFSVIGRAASLYTDPFIMISGTLTAYSLIGKLNRTGKINVIQEYVSRLFRIVPTFAALIVFCTLILPWLNAGPLWNMVVTEHSDICKNYWWRNLLFIHNYFGFKDMCLTHTHHVGIDTQLFFVSPFLIYLIWKWPRAGSLGLILLATLSTIMRYYVTFTMKLSNYIHFGTSIEQLFATADNMYILPPHRATVYIMGVFLGYILRNCKNITLSKAQLRIGNTVALFSLLVSFFSPAFMGKIDYVYNATDAAFYAAFSPILWVGSFAWVIFTTHLGYKGTIGNIFSHPVWTLWTKISYTVYLTQFPIYFFNVGVARSSQTIGFFSALLNLQEYFWVIALSAALSLTVEMPFQNIRNLVIKDKEVKSTARPDSKKSL